MGKDSLSPADQLTLETAKMMREDFLQQNAFDGCGLLLLLSTGSTGCWQLILRYRRAVRSEAIEEWRCAPPSCSTSPARRQIGRAKNVPEESDAQSL
ncbi:MAG: hypothetical protein ACLRWQ_19675 [Flavonifractor plautii]